MTDTPAARRRRRRRTATAEPAAPSTATHGDSPAATDAQVAAKARKRGSAPRRSERGSGADRALSSLVGAGPSQVGVVGALRARDVNRPTEEDLAEAEREIEIVRRHWQPDDHH